MEEPLISVIVPVYKVEAYLRRCLDSIVNQTYRNLEIILVDDGSPDHSGAICDAYAKRDRRIRVIHKVNGGVSSARNAGLEAASGEYIGWVDSDDWIENDMFEYLKNLAVTCQADVAQCGRYWENGDFVAKEYGSLHGPQTIDLLSEITPAMWNGIANEVWCKLFKSDIIENLRFREDFSVGEDIDFILHVLRKAERLAIGSEAKYHYCQRPESLYNAGGSLDILLRCRETFLNLEEEFAQEKDYLRFLKGEAIKNRFMICSRIAANGLAHDHRNTIALVRDELRKDFSLRKEGVFSLKEQIKWALIVFCWPAYCLALRMWNYLKYKNKKQI